MSITHLTLENFDSEVLAASETVLIDFWAEWCGPCRMINPILEEVAAEAGSNVKVCKINVDEQPELAEKFQVMSIPMLAVFQNGKLVRSAVGLRPKSDILKMLE
ncbi:MAG TPA: thioredoxin [Clostridiales bacterium]|mgnify:CR=1 FL=1|jgi:thioredoxin 1|nr:thioredoxin [Clostridiales bacterium]